MKTMGQIVQELVPAYLAARRQEVPRWWSCWPPPISSVCSCSAIVSRAAAGPLDFRSSRGSEPRSSAPPKPRSSLLQPGLGPA